MNGFELDITPLENLKLWVINLRLVLLNLQWEFGGSIASEAVKMLNITEWSSCGKYHK